MATDSLFLYGLRLQLSATLGLNSGNLREIGEMAYVPIDPPIYSRYNKDYCTFQYAAAYAFVLRCAAKSDWCGLIGQQVVDLGCGPGTSTKMIRDLFPGIGQIMAMDAHQPVLDLAKALYPEERVQYFLADISNRAQLECWEGAMPRVISTWCLQYLKDQRQAFSNIRYILRPQGEAAVMFLLHSSYYDALCDVAQSPKWKDHLQDVPEELVPESHKKKLDASHYKALLEEVGFEVLLCEMETREHKFNTDEECEDFLSSLCTVMHRLPADMKKPFFKDFVSSFMKFNPRCLDKRIAHKFTYLQVLAKKSGSDE